MAIDTGTARLVRDTPTSVTLLVNEVPSSHLDLARPGFLAFEYFQQMDAVLATLLPGPVRALHLGAAGCALARAWDHERPGSRQVAVDIDARLVELARQWFDLPRAPRLRLRAQDAHAAVFESKAGWYDVIVRDVFAGDQTPASLRTAEFASAVARALRPGGLYLANCADRPPLNLVRQELRALRGAFSQVAVIAEVGVLAGKRRGNFVLAGAQAPTDPREAQTPFDTPLDSPFDSPTLARRLRSLPVPARLATGPELTRLGW